MNSRPFAVSDMPMLQAAMDVNTFHPGQKAEWYLGPARHSVVYEDDQGPIGVLRYTKTLRLCTVWCNNSDRARNGAATMQAIKDSVIAAQKNGFTEIIFQTDSPLLAKFCVDKLGFEASNGEYRLGVPVTPKEEAQNV